MKWYTGCYSVLVNILQANVRTVIERLLVSVTEFVPVVTLYSVPFYAAVLQCTKLFSRGCL